MSSLYKLKNVVSCRFTVFCCVSEDLLIAMYLLFYLFLRTCKKTMLCCNTRLLPVAPDAQPEIFQGRGGFVKLGRFDKYFIKKSRKKAPQRKISSFFLLDTLKTTFRMANST